MSLNFRRLSLDDASAATGITIVIDVLRAFTSACYAFGAGADEIFLVSEIAEAFALRQQFPGALLMGEVGGGPIEGFDFSNSPAHYVECNLRSKRLIQRTSNGTQGVVRAVRADHVLAASFMCAAATARYIQAIGGSQVTFVITAWHDDSPTPRGGDEDAACADYLEALLCGDAPDPTPYLARVNASPTGALFATNTRPEYPATDLPYCTDLDCFDFALPVQRTSEGLLRMTPQRA